MAKVKRLKGGTFNVLYGRDKSRVKAEVTRFLKKHDLDFLCLQEAQEYLHEFRSIPGYTYIFDRSGWAGIESTILVKNTHRADREKFYKYGDGWITVRGGNHAASGQMEIRIDKWCYVRSLHLPTPSDWHNGKLVSPSDRRDDLVASMRGLRRYFSWPCILTARVAAGDWNEPPETTGEYSPRWLASNTGARAIAADSRAGHGRIDYPMVKGAKIVKVFKDLEFNENSDHEPVVFVIAKGK